MSGIESIEFSGAGRTVTLDREKLGVLNERLAATRRLDIDPRIWERVADKVNELYAQVAGGARAAGKVALTFAVLLDPDGLPVVKIALADGSKRVGTWTSAEGGQLTLEGV